MSERSHNRRTFLATAGIAIAGLAGCSGSDDDEGEDGGDTQVDGGGDEGGDTSEDGSNDGSDTNDDGSTEQERQSPPNIVFSFEFDVTDEDEVEEFTISIDTVDAEGIDPDTIKIRGDLALSDETWDREGASVAAGASVTIGDDDSDYMTGELVSGNEVQIVFETAATSDTLAVGEVP